MMDVRHTLALHLWITVFLVSTSTAQTPVPAPTFVNPYEKYTNQTIDQIITSTLGGTEVAANQILDYGEHILAELDMFLTKDQFLNMYQPPEPEAMMEMGMMAAPIGTVYDPERQNFYGPEERHRRDEPSGGGPPKDRQKRKAARDTTLRWTDGIMPYNFAKGHFEKNEEYMMRRSMTEWERYTCVRFRPAKSSDKNSVHFQNGAGCNSQLGMIGGIQMLNLQAPGCRFKGLYLHEIGHALGLVHEHQLPNRDNHIRILYNNVSPSMRIWFNKYTTKEVNQMNVPYQLSSVMHYGITAFSKDGKSQTIQALDRNKEDTIGRVYLKELAYTDVDIVNKMYKCADHCPDQTKCGPKGHLDQNCNCICEDGSSDCDRTKGNRDNNCVNQFDTWSCYIWANQGECERNTFYMEKYCTKACHKCPGDQAIDSCKDVYSQATCTVWKERGDCVTNPGWMSRHCKATCKMCSGQSKPATCKDSHADAGKCQEWALKGECKVNPKWMYDNCKKSCDLCDKPGPEEEGTGDGGDEDKLECTNTHEKCEYWAGSKECEDNPGWMINNCRKACNKCDDGQCKNLYDDTQCEIWEQKMDCLQNREWMSRHCAKSCHTGPCSKSGGGGSHTTPTTITKRPGITTTTKRTVVTPNPSCKNRHNSDTQCEMWAKNDHCNINPSWMLKYCAKACGSCSGGGSASRTTTAKTVPTTDANGGVTVSECLDTNTQCPSWAKHGFCDNNPRYNLVHCKKSCNNCNGCRDTEVLCSVWAGAGHCEKNARFMLRQCQKSCKACYMKAGDVRAILTTPSGTKTDGDPDSSSNQDAEGSSPILHNTTHYTFVSLFLLCVICRLL